MCLRTDHGYRTDRSKLDFTQLRELSIYWDTDYKDMIYALIHANRLLLPQTTMYSNNAMIG
jgi:hypothetical protein